MVDGITERQLQILICAAEGWTAAQTGKHLGIAARSVHRQRATAYKRLGVHGLDQALAKLGLVKADVEEPPLVSEQPFAAAFVQQFERWLMSGKNDQRASKGMGIAWLGIRNGR